MRWERVRFSEEDKVLVLVDWKRRVGLLKRDGMRGERANGGLCAVENIDGRFRCRCRHCCGLLKVL